MNMPSVFRTYKLNTINDILEDPNIDAYDKVKSLDLYEKTINSYVTPKILQDYGVNKEILNTIVKPKVIDVIKTTILYDYKLK